jgi:hypothetical protein
MSILIFLTNARDGTHFEIESKQNVYVQVGMGFNLSCNGNDNWKICTWKRTSKNGAKCEIRYTYLHREEKWMFDKHVCDLSIASHAIDGSIGFRNGTRNHICQLRFATAQLSHEGKWTCTLESCKVPKNGGCKAADGSGIFAEAKIKVKVVLSEKSISLHLTFIVFKYLNCTCL